MSLSVVTESNTAFLPVSFLDDAGDAVAPTAATYRIDDEESETVLKVVTAIAPLSPSVTITIDSTENVIVNSNREYEIHVLTVEWDYLGSGGSTHGAAAKRFKVTNLLGVE